MEGRTGIWPYRYWVSAARETDPLKRWRLSPIATASLDKWDDCTEAKGAMFFYADTADAPWVIGKSNAKMRAGLNCMRHFLEPVDWPGKDLGVVGTPDPMILGRAARVLQGAAIYWTRPSIPVGLTAGFAVDVA